MKHTLSVLVENKPGVLARIAGLFSRRGFNIDSLAVGPTQDDRFSYMTVVVDAEEHSLEQITKQLRKLVSVIKLNDLKRDESVWRELALIKVKAKAAHRPEIAGIVEMFRAKIIENLVFPDWLRCIVSYLVEIATISIDNPDLVNLCFQIT